MQNSIKFNYINLVEYKNLDLWDVKQNVEDKLLYNFPISKLGKALKKAKIEWIEIKNNDEYPILGVRAQGKGVYINRVAKGSELKMRKYQKSKELTLFYCKVRTVNGQWGVVYPEFADSYGSSNMQYLDIDFNTLNPEYLELILKSETITQEWDKRAIGADGRHFNLRTLLDLEIPLPHLDEQKALVKAYQSKFNQAEKLKQEATNLEEKIEEYLYKELGIQKAEKKEAKKGLHFVRFKDIDRWDILNLLSSSFNFSSKFPISNIKNVIYPINYDLKGKSLRFESKYFSTNHFNYIGMENIEKEKGLLNEFQYVTGDKIKSQTIKVPFGFSIYGKLRPYLNKYWLNNSNNENIICSSEFFVYKTKDYKVNDLFLNYIIGSSIVQKQIKDKFSGVRMPRISSNDFLNLKIPVPSIDIQNKIASTIQQMKENQKQKLQQAEQLKRQALTDFENAIFKPTS